MTLRRMPETMALREAGLMRGSWWLSGTLLYCTLEPCSMCAGARLNAPVETLAYGARPTTRLAVRVLS